MSPLDIIYMALKEKRKKLSIHMGYTTAYTTTWSLNNDQSQINYKNTTCPILWGAQMTVRCDIFK